MIYAKDRLTGNITRYLGETSLRIGEVAVETESPEPKHFAAGCYTIDSSGRWFEIVNGRATRLDAKETADLEAQTVKNRQDVFNSEINEIKSGYSEEEVQSWFKQEAEAVSWLADNSTTTVLCDAVLAVTGGDKAEFMANVVRKANLYAVAYGAALGRKRL